MEKENSLKIQIDKYITGELVGEELAFFEEKLMADQELKATVDAQKEVHETLLANIGYKKQDAAMGSFMDQLADEFIVNDTNKQAKIVDLKPEREVVASNENTQKPLIRWLIPAATLAAAAVVLLMFFPSGQADLPSYAKNYYLPYEASFAVKGDINDLAKAGNFYESESWAAALDIFAKHPDNYKAQLAKGNCEYQLKQFDKASITFKKVADSNSEYADSAAWYVALSYLQQANKVDALVYLKKVSKQSAYYKQAVQLLKKLS